MNGTVVSGGVGSGGRTGRALVIGIGNPLHRDDGAGPAVVETLASRATGADLRTDHCLLPELAEDLAGYSQVIFIDAAVPADAEAATVRVVPVVAELAHPVHGHTCSPSDVLALAALLGHPLPRAWLVTIPAADLGVGHGLSASTSAHLPHAAAAVADLLTRRRAGSAQ